MVPHVDSLQWWLWLNNSGLSACWLLLPCYVVAVKRFEGTFNINSEVFLYKLIQGLKDVIIVYSLHSFPWIQNPEHVYNQSLECLTGRNMFKKRHHCAVAVAASALLAARPFLPRLFSNLEKKDCIPFFGCLSVAAFQNLTTREESSLELLPSTCNMSRQASSLVTPTVLVVRHGETVPWPQQRWMHRSQAS